jgi:hypothetical protein
MPPSIRYVEYWMYDSVDQQQVKSRSNMQLLAHIKYGSFKICRQCLATQIQTTPILKVILCPEPLPNSPLTNATQLVLRSFSSSGAVQGQLCHTGFE